MDGSEGKHEFDAEYSNSSPLYCPGGRNSNTQPVHFSCKYTHLMFNSIPFMNEAYLITVVLFEEFVLTKYSFNKLC